MHHRFDQPCKCRFSDNTRVYLEEFQAILDEMIRGMEGAELADSISYNFIVQMIPHHRGAVEMSKWTLEQCICPELVPILEAIVTSQERGIRQMTELLCRLENCNCVDG